MALAYQRPGPSNRPSLELVTPRGVVEIQPSPQLWLALVFPSLPLEAAGIQSEERAAIAVLESDESRSRIFALTAGAERGGIRTGMSAEAALSLVPEVKFVQRNPVVERERLLELAAWCERFTPTISMQVPDALLLEMRGSLHLFGDASQLRERLRATLRTKNCRPLVAFAPTPRSALWLARAGREAILENRAQLCGALGDVPLAALHWPKSWQEAFARLGLRTLTDLLRLPRDGLTHRFGPELLDELDHALGASPDPLSLWTSPAAYQDQADLGFDTWQTDILLPVIETLLVRLAQVLQIRDASLQSFELWLCGTQGVASSLAIGTRDVGRDVAHWMRLVRTQLEAQRLTHAIHTVRIVAGRFEPFSSCSVDLFARSSSTNTRSLAELIDLLRARLGRRGVAGLRTVATQRPERASRFVAPGHTSPVPLELSTRPLWLLHPPNPMDVWDAAPAYRGRGLVLEEGPERIECGGWLDWQVRRDYYIARDQTGSRLWVYRELDPPAHWFLHGYFA